MQHPIGIRGRSQAGLAGIQRLVISGIIAGISLVVVPSYLKGRAASQEESMKGALRLFHSANQAYKVSAGGTSGYAASRTGLTETSHGRRRFLDPRWNAPIYDGFRLFYHTDKEVGAAHFMLSAQRAGLGPFVKAIRLCVDERGLIFLEDNPVAEQKGNAYTCSRGIVVV